MNKMPAVSLKSLEKIVVQDILQNIDTILTDCDGVLWVIDKAIEGVPRTVGKLKESGKRFLYVTNNSRHTRRGFATQLKALGYGAEPDEIICTSHLAAKYLKSKNFTKKVYLVGDPAIGDELNACGISHTGTGADVVGSDLVSAIKSFVPDPEIGAVVMSLDEHISFPKLMKAATYLNNPDVLFVATSMDVLVPIPNNGRIPGPGAIIKCVEACSGRQPVVVGKPEAFITQEIISGYGLNLERTLFIGDSLDSDMLLGNRCGIKTLLVLTGVTTEEELKALDDSKDLKTRESIPDFYVDSLADLQNYL